MGGVNLSFNLSWVLGGEVVGAVSYGGLVTQSHSFPPLSVSSLLSL